VNFHFYVLMMSAKTDNRCCVFRHVPPATLALLALFLLAELPALLAVIVLPGIAGAVEQLRHRAAAEGRWLPSPGLRRPSVLAGHALGRGRRARPDFREPRGRGRLAGTRDLIPCPIREKRGSA